MQRTMKQMVDKPQPTLKDQITGFVILAALCYGAWLYFSSGTPEPSAEELAAAEAARVEANAACRRTLGCWAERHHVAASVRCPREVERLARFTMEWTDGWTEPKFSHYRWRDVAAGTVTYIGDRARFQNGFGAWQNMVYECDFDGELEQVLSVRASPGRL